MRKRRYLVPWRRGALATGQIEAAAQAAGTEGAEGLLRELEGKPAIYHCITRVAGGHRCLGFDEKEKFVEILRRHEAFCMVRVLTFCVMSNHVHILVEVPGAPGDRGGSWSDEEFLAHLSKLYRGGELAGHRWRLENLRRRGLDGAAREFRERFFARMWDLSSFMKGVNQSFAQWFNRTRGRRGHLWGDRFKSVVVEGGRAARVVAAYIDLNPVRAGIAEDPGDYRWSGYGRAAAGDALAREGLRWTVFESAGMEAGRAGAARMAANWAEAGRRYRELLSEAGEKRGGGGRAEAGGSSAEAGGGRLSEAGMLRGRVRYFSDGLVVGSRGFVESVFGLTRGYFGAGRSSGARPLRGVDTPLKTMRDLRKDALGAPET